MLRPLMIGCFLACFGLLSSCTRSQSDPAPGSVTPDKSLSSKSNTSPPELDPQSMPGGIFGADNSPSPGTSVPVVKGLQRSKTGLAWQMIRSGTGDRPKKGQKISIHYEARVQGGPVFDSTKDKSPLTFSVGRSQLNRGMEEGVMDMSLGEKRILTIPPKLAYGVDGVPGLIPPNSTLEVTIEMVGLLEEE